MVSRLGLVTVVVPDYDEAITFFTEALGFDLVDDMPQGDKRWVVVGPPGGGTGILLAQAVGAAQEAVIGNQAGGRVGFFLHTEDFAAQYARMLEAGVVFREAPRHEPYGTVAVFEDRWGNPWDLIQPKGAT